MLACESSVFNRMIPHPVLRLDGLKFLKYWVNEQASVYIDHDWYR